MHLNKFSHIIFDYGGVMHRNFLHSFNAFKKEFHLEENDFQNAYQKFLPALNTGKISDQEFVTNIHLELNLPAPETYINYWVKDCDTFIVLPEMKALVIDLQEAGYQCVVFSNTVKPVADYIKSRGGYEFFDQVFLSNEIGLAKPDLKVYQYVLNQLNAKPESCIYLDDLEVNLIPANNLGITTILVENSKQVEKKIKRILFS
ncbi:MAG: HAD family phosphatase [bacterium]